MSLSSEEHPRPSTSELMALGQGMYDEELAHQTARLDRLRPQARRALTVVEIRCPAVGKGGGHLLGTVYELPTRKGGTSHYLYRGRTAAGTPHAALLNFPFVNNWEQARVFVPVGCSHGHARLRLDWLLHCVIACRSPASESVEQLVAASGPEMQRGRASGVFHPDPSAWRPKLT